MFLHSYVSGVTILGTPAEIYNYGTQYWLVIVAVALSCLVVVLVYLPVFCTLRLSSSYEVRTLDCTYLRAIYQSSFETSQVDKVFRFNGQYVFCYFATNSFEDFILLLILQDNVYQVIWIKIPTVDRPYEKHIHRYRLLGNLITRKRPTLFRISLVECVGFCIVSSLVGPQMWI